MEKVYKFLLTQPLQFFKAGQYFAKPGWKHKDVINRGDYEIIMMIDGDIHVQIGNEQISLTEHDCLLIPPYIRHFGFKGSQNGSIYYWMHFFPNGEVTSSFSQNLTTNGYEVKIPYKFQSVNFERLAILVRELLDNANDSDPIDLASNYIISSILIELSHQYTSSIHRPQTSTRFEIIKNWIRIHSHDNISVKSIAEEFQITPVYLSRLFNLHEHMPTVKFINTVKIEQAQELLLTTDNSVKEIAFELNFSNEKYFLKVFKQLTSTTPTKYRNSYSKTYLNNVEVDPQIPLPDEHKS